MAFQVPGYASADPLKKFQEYRFLLLHKYPQLPHDLQKRIQELGTPCEYFPTFDEIENYLLSNCQEGDLLITMGAGDVVNIGEHLLGK